MQDHKDPKNDKESEKYTQALAKANKALEETAPLLLRNSTYIQSNHELALMTQLWNISKDLTIEDQARLYEDILKKTSFEKQRIQKITDGAILLGFMSTRDLLKACGKSIADHPSYKTLTQLSSNERNDLLKKTKQLQDELLQVKNKEPDVINKARESFANPAKDVPKTEEERQQARLQRAIAILILDGDDKYRAKATKFDLNRRYLGSKDAESTHILNQTIIQERSEFLGKIMKQVPASWQIAFMEGLVHAIPCDPFGLLGPVDKKEEKEYKNETEDKSNGELLEKFNLAKSEKSHNQPGEPPSRSQCLATLVNNFFQLIKGVYEEEKFKKPIIRNKLNYPVCVLYTTQDEKKEHSIILKPGESATIKSSIKSIRAIAEPVTALPGIRSSQQVNQPVSKEVYLNPKILNQEAMAREGFEKLSVHSLMFEISEKEKLADPFVSDPENFPIGFEESFRQESPFLFGGPLRLKGPEDTKIINPFIHVHWQGRYLSEEQLNCVESWVKNNPEAIVIVWTDMTAEDNSNDAKRIKARCAKMGAKLCNISQVLNNDEILGNPLKSLGLERIYKSYLLKPNFAAAADLVRATALFVFGGVYADMDRSCYFPLYFLRQAYQFLYSYGQNDFIMARRANSTLDPHPINEYIRTIVNKHKQPAMKDSINWTGWHFNFSEEDEAMMRMTSPDAFIPAVNFYQESNADQGGVVALRDEHVGQLNSQTIYSYTHGQLLCEWITGKDESAKVVDARKNEEKSLTALRVKELSTCMLNDWYNFGFLNETRYQHSLMRKHGADDLFFAFIEGVLDYYTPAARALYNAQPVTLLPSNLKPKLPEHEEKLLPSDVRAILAVKAQQLELILKELKVAEEELKVATKDIKPTAKVIEEIGWKLFFAFSDSPLELKDISPRDVARMRDRQRPTDIRIASNWSSFLMKAPEVITELASSCLEKGKLSPVDDQPSLDDVKTVEDELSNLIKQSKLR